MKVFSTREKNNFYTMSEAINLGIAPDGGLFLPKSFPKFKEDSFKNLYDLSLDEFAFNVLYPFFSDEIQPNDFATICAKTFDFPLHFKNLSEKLYLLELFHGPTAAFKDFGAKFLANFLEFSRGSDQSLKTIIVATSGDTGGAVASAFFEKKGFNIVILFPKGLVSERQKSQLTCWGGNILSLEVEGTFDDCQKMAKTLMTEHASTFDFGSANSINIARLLPQSIYHAYTALHLYRITGEVHNFIVPTGNLGNALACYWAREMGFPISGIVFATNNNKTLSEYFESHSYNPRPSVATIANAMDVGDPSNFERLVSMNPKAFENKNLFSVNAASDQEIYDQISSVFKEFGEMICPHTATAFIARQKLKLEDQHVVLVGTAHPCKFDEIVMRATDIPVPICDAMREIENLPSYYEPIENDLEKTLSAIKRHQLNQSN